MGEQVKDIIKELNKEPFSKKLNLISFDALKSEALLQLLNDVSAEIDPKTKADVRAEDPEQLTLKTLSFLRVLKYKPPPEIELSQFRQGIVMGNKIVIYHILEWLLKRLPELKKRAYLAQYLVKVELPPDIEVDADVSDLYSQYEQLIEEFKDVHKEYENLKSSGYTTQDLRKDCDDMDIEKEQLLKKLDRVKMKVESHPNVEAMLTLARTLREERDREDSLNNQKLEQKNACLYAEQRIQRLSQQLKELRHSNLGATPESLLQKLEEEVKVNSYIVNEKLPKEMTKTTKYIQDLQHIVNEPAMGQLELDQLSEKIQKVNSEINKLVEQRMISSDPIDDKLSLYRQQSSIIRRKKESQAEELKLYRQEITQLQEQISGRQALQTNEVEGEMLKSDEFKRYVNKLRGKSTVYKKKKQELAELKAECGVLSRTYDILQQKDSQITNTLAHMEDQKGVSGFHMTQEELEKVSSKKAEIDEQKGQTLEEMALMVRRLNGRIAEKKARLAPVIKELRPLRQQCQDMTFEYEQKKGSYEACFLSLESNISKLQQHVNTIKDEIISNETDYHKFNVNICMLKLKHDHVIEEIKSYVSNDPTEKKKSIRETLNKKIQEQEGQTKLLREQQRQIKENHSVNEKQVKMWNNLKILLECKKTCKELSNQTKPVTLNVTDHLVL